MFDFIQSVIQGKTIYRILFHRVLYRNRSQITGTVLDLASGPSPSYYSYLNNGLVVTKTDYTAKPGIDATVDFNKPLPFESESYDTVCIFHALYIAEDPERVLQEVRRILKKGGTLAIAMPFVANEMPEPHDYHRYTLEGLDLLITKSGFTPNHRERIGERATAAVYIIAPLLYIWPIKLIAYTIAVSIDRLIPQKLIRRYPFPIGYFYIAKKY
jgi:SAM-dependent methyltransferase